VFFTFSRDERVSVIADAVAHSSTVPSPNQYEMSNELKFKSKRAPDYAQVKQPTGREDRIKKSKQ